jgi:protein-L-isoaspartate(D-aspartate) O-methyltransferase
MKKKESIDDYYNSLDRKIFLDGEYKKCSGVDAPLPIGFGQTISQPSLVLRMTKLLELSEDLSVLEIGTGSGYQTALLARFSGCVHTVERIKELSEAAEKRIKALGFKNVIFHIGDGSLGLLGEAPFDRIIVTAGAGRYPEDLVDQLAHGGRMIIPIGQRYFQDLVLIKKDNNGKISKESLGGVVFVEFIGEYGF